MSNKTPAFVTNTPKPICVEKNTCTAAKYQICKLTFINTIRRKVKKKRGVDRMLLTLDVPNKLQSTLSVNLSKLLLNIKPLIDKANKQPNVGRSSINKTFVYVFLCLMHLKHRENGNTIIIRNVVG